MLLGSRQALNLLYYISIIYYIYICDGILCICFLDLDKLSIYGHIIYIYNAYVMPYIIYMLPGSRQALNLLYYVYIIYTYVMAYYTYASWISTSSQSTAILYIYIYNTYIILYICVCVYIIHIYMYI